MEEGFFAPDLKPLQKGRTQKPRLTGITMVMDTGLGLESTRELLELAGPFIDFVKLGFGTAYLYPAGLLQAKVRLLRSYGVHVYCGGTFLEAAEVQGKAEVFLQKIHKAGFDFVEISDGTVPLSLRRRRELLLLARDLGLEVVTEVGQKHPEDRLPLSRWVEAIHQDLKAGARFVLVEARESGRGTGLYDEKGEVDEEVLEALEGAAPLERLIWEAPQKHQQLFFLQRHGVNANLGNIPPQGVLSLEALRLGLRADSLRRLLREKRVRG
ncbi:MAG: phosphosulfolactate synthase [Clostridiales bacterium]|nr:phosphosulfolactate synthase [Clostridiales bacterium]